MAISHVGHLGVYASVTQELFRAFCVRIVGVETWKEHRILDLAYSHHTYSSREKALK